MMVDEKEIKDFTVILENDRKEHSVLVVLG